MDKQKPFILTRSCPVTVEVQNLKEYPIITGHWFTYDHIGAPRTIDESVLIYCTAGGGVLRLGKHEFSIQAGDLFLCPPNVNHQYRCHKDTGWEIWWVHYKGDHADSISILAGLSEQTPVMIPSDQDRICCRFKALIERMDQEEKDMDIDGSELLHQLLFEIYRQSARLPRGNDLTVYAEKSARTVDEMAKNAGYSKYHFCRLFKKQTGRSPWQYVLDRKVEWAKELLIGTRLSIKEISAQLDFDNPDYFAKLFRERVGVNPVKYRGH